jgi:hypothetical protein
MKPAGHKNGMHVSLDHDSGRRRFAPRFAVSGVQEPTAVAIVTKIEEVFPSRTMSAIFYSFNLRGKKKEEKMQ